jgi:AraC-like DNA-binding protein
VDEAASFCGDRYYPISLAPLRSSTPFSLALDVTRLGPITIGDLHVGADIRMDSGELGDWYHVNVPLAGRVQSRHRASVVTATKDRAAAFQPTGDSVLRWGAGSRQLCVKIESSALEAELERMLGHPVRVPPRLAPSLDLAVAAGRSWAQLVRLLGNELHNRDSLVYQPLMSDRLWHGVLSGLLLAVDHQYREALWNAAAPCRPRTVKRAIDAMVADPAHPFTTAELATIAGVGMRALQEGFQRSVGTPPMAYLRQLRLARVHEELRQAEPTTTTVAEVAHRWGFAHLGRFAGAYRERYGATPSQTLGSA